MREREAKGGAKGEEEGEKPSAGTKGGRETPTKGEEERVVENQIMRDVTHTQAHRLHSGCISIHSLTPWTPRHTADGKEGRSEAGNRNAGPTRTPGKHTRHSDSGAGAAATQGHRDTEELSILSPSAPALMQMTCATGRHAREHKDQ